MKKTLRDGGYGPMSRLLRMAVEPKLATSGSTPRYGAHMNRLRAKTPTRAVPAIPIRAVPATEGDRHRVHPNEARDWRPPCEYLAGDRLQTRPMGET